MPSNEINALLPTADQVQEFVELPDNPIVMLNLLRFKADGGADEYAKYAAAIAPILEKVGAKILFSGEAAMCFIGAADWDFVVLVEYPNPRVLMTMAQSDEYQAIHHHREAGLQGQVNYAVFPARL